MSKQRFTNAFREALWEAHSRKCLYCERDIAFVSMEIDHVIPESILKNLIQLQETKSRLGLEKDFSILGFENLAPACRECNGRKRALPLPDGSVMIFIGKIRSRIPELERLIKKQVEARNLDNTLRYIAKSLESEKYSAEQLVQGLKRMERIPDGVWGASPSAPPMSPETIKYGINISDRSRILWSPQSLAWASRFELTSVDLNHLIRKAVENSTFNVKKIVGPENKYVLRLGYRGLRLVFQPSEGGTIIHNIYRR